MSTLHAALTGLLAAKDETGDRLVHVDTIRDALRRHPAPEAGEVRLTEAEREALRGLGQGQVPAAVERILAARLAEVAQPAGETRVEWGVRGDQDSACRSKEAALATLERFRRGPYRVRGRRLIRRTVGEWEEVAGDE